MIKKILRLLVKRYGIDNEIRKSERELIGYAIFETANYYSWNRFANVLLRELGGSVKEWGDKYDNVILSTAVKLKK